MAKKTKKPTQQDLDAAVVVATLKRAISQIESGMVVKKTVLEQGSYPVTMTVTIDGDITVGRASPAGELIDVPSFKDGELLGAMFAVLSADERRSVLSRALTLIKKSGEAETSKAKINEAFKVLAIDVLAMAKKRDMTVRKPSSNAQAGKVQGKPSVKLSGTFGERTVSLDVEREDAA